MMHMHHITEHAWKEIQKYYKKEDLQNVKIVNDEDRKTAEDLEIGDWMYKTTPREVFITLKDHKSVFPPILKAGWLTRPNPRWAE